MGVTNLTVITKFKIRFLNSRYDFTYNPKKKYQKLFNNKAQGRKYLSYGIALNSKNPFLEVKFRRIL
jgi:hypothetical protein